MLCSVEAFRCALDLYQITRLPCMHLYGHIIFDVRGSVHHSTILTEKKPPKMQHCIKILLFLILNEAQHVSGDTPPIIRSLKLHKQPLVSHTWKVVGRPTTARLRTFHGIMQNQRLLVQF